ncbi:mitochondrial carrier [Microthyrium microscopicum]|uniref:Mitochondrial carrier n=1 Tax=Microthyrium microscopicum TaxID=703497 RepID=A0A6A6UCI0_9PEZI|nr:mitochondrial carrier [Microthyrium microscopicum]
MGAYIDEEALRPPYIHAMLAGGFGGTTGDMLMHSIDTVKTRQQGDPHIPPKYTTLGSSYWKILRQEGIRKGLYGGVLPAFLGSFTGTVLFFGSYEYTKRTMIDLGVTPWLAYFNAGVIADVIASPLYVPSEVLKTRLQLQGRHNNPFFQSGYNYRSTLHALTSIVRYEGLGALFYGYKATLYRDVPFSALQFAFYEQEQKIARSMVGNRDIGLPLEIFTGASAGCMAGVITCPLDVVKTRIQTQIIPIEPPSVSPAQMSSGIQKHSSSNASKKATHNITRHISTSSPSTTIKPPQAAMLDTSSILTGLKLMYRTEGFAGLFRGVGPRAVWTAVQSGTMLVLYQQFLKYFEQHPITSEREPS